MPPREAPAANPVMAFCQQWLGAFEQAGALGRQELEAAALFHDARRLRSLWLAELTTVVDRYMRSAPFLQLMQFNLQALTRPSSLAPPHGSR